jgi:6-pyruvoyltetrahydropterin/6-carboxytetrahydropterin synthase
MFRLSREVRFAINREAGVRPQGANNYAANPPLIGWGHYFAVAVSLSGELDPRSQYLVNIKEIDAAVRERAIDLVAAAVRSSDSIGPSRVVADLFHRLAAHWPKLQLEAVRLSLSPLLCVSAHAKELPMTRLSEKFEFSASHRLHNPSLTDEENRRCFGKCNNPSGHGHNYELQVTLAGEPDASGVLVDVQAFERVVSETVINRFDHKNLNVEVPEFRELIPSVENIARVIYRLLKPRFESERAELAAITVWETPKTWCEYSE